MDSSAAQYRNEPRRPIYIQQITRSLQLVRGQLIDGWVINLLENAIATRRPGGGIRRSGSAGVDSPGSQQARSGDYLDKFARGNKSRRNPGVAGWALPSVQAVAAHGGTISASNGPRQAFNHVLHRRENALNWEELELDMLLTNVCRLTMVKIPVGRR